MGWLDGFNKNVHFLKSDINGGKALMVIKGFLVSWVRENLKMHWMQQHKRTTGGNLIGKAEMANLGVAHSPPTDLVVTYSS